MKPTALLLILSVLLLSGCTPPPDFAVCRPLVLKTETKVVEGIGTVTLERPNPKCMKEIGEPSCGFCVWTISNRSQFVGDKKSAWLLGQPWSQVKAQSVLVPVKEYAKVKSFVVNICKKTEECNKDISRWRLKLDSLDSIF